MVLRYIHTSLLLFILIFQGVFAQSLEPVTLNDTLNCGGGTPTFEVDLTGNPGGTWTSNPEQRGGACCNPGGDNNCVQFNVTLDPGAEGILFSVPDGCGASPSGSLFYQVDCGPLTSVGTPLCLSGTGPFVITFCKPGNNENCYSIASIPAPSSSGDILTADGCQDTLSVFGLNPASVTWSSIPQNGQPVNYYNNYLSNLTGGQQGTSGVLYDQDLTTVLVTPQPGYPPTIAYQVCGTVLGACSAASFCDTASVSIFPTLFVDPGPSVAICNGTVTGATVTMGAIGGTAPYTYTWTGPGGFSQTNVSNSATDNITAMIAGTYTCVISDATGCPTATGSVIVTEFFVDIVADPGPDQAVCGTPAPTVLLNSTVSGTNSGIWSGGNGTYTDNVNDLSLSYIPTAAEIAAGSVTLTLTPTNTGGCPNTANQVVINLTQFTSTLNAIPTDISCNGLTNGSINLTVSPGAPAYATSTYSWSTGAVTEDISGLAVGSYTVTVTDVNGCTASTTASIAQPTPVTLSFTQVNVVCFGGSTGSVDLTPSGGTPSYTYSWSNGATTQDVSGLIAGTYTVTVNDANGTTAGCTASTSVTITEPLAPVSITFTQTNVSCFGGSDGAINITPAGGTPGYTYSWSNGATTEDISGLTAGTFTVIVNDANGSSGGCSSTVSVTITEPLAPVTLSSTQVNILCFGGATGSIDLSATGGTPGYTYLWSNGATTQDISGLLAGTYSVTVNDASGAGGGCASALSVTITQPIAPVTVSGTQVEVLCFGGSNASIDITPAGGTPGYTYSWSNGATTQDVSGLIAGTYTVTVNDASGTTGGCTALASFTIAQPAAPVTVSTTQVDVLCFGGTTGSVDLTPAGGTPGYSYLWSNGATTQDISGLPAGTYTVVVNDANGTNGGCTASTTVIVVEPLAPLTVTGTQIDVLCFGGSNGSIDITPSGGTPAYSYLWSNGATTQDLSGVAAGTYSVVVSDANGSTGGCTATTSFTIVQPLAPVSVTSTQVDILCFGDATGSVDITPAGGTPAYTYSWSTGATTQDISGVPAGSYTVTINDANGSTGGCATTLTVTLTEPTLLTSSVIPSIYPGGFNLSGCAPDGWVDLTVNGGISNYSYVWSNGANTEDISNLLAGTYIVTITDNNGCTTTNTITLTSPSGLSQTVSSPTFPSGNNISCFGASDGTVDLSPIGGAPPYTFLWSNGGTTEDLSNVPAGTYNVTITDDNGCQIVSSITLTQPTALTQSTAAFTYPSGDNISCFGFSDGSIDLTIGSGSPEYTYSWSNGATSEDIGGVPAGTYNVIATDINGCTISASATLIEPTLLTQSNVPGTYPSGDNISCFGLSDGSVNLSVSGGSPGYSYAWSNGAVTEDISGAPAGTYSVIITDLNGCQVTTSITLVEPVALTQSNTPFTYPSGDNISCNGFSDGSIDLTIGGGSPTYNYLWSNGSSNQDISGLTAGTYTVTVTDVNGCTITSSATLIEPAPLNQSITAGTFPSGDNISCFGFNDGSIDYVPAGGSPGYTYSWTTINGTGLVPGNEDQTGLTTGTYQVTLTDINGCQQTTSITLVQPTALDLSLTPSVYSGGFNLSACDDDGTIDATISGGSPGYSYAWSPNGEVIEDLSNLAAGTYSLIVTDLNGCQIIQDITLTQPIVVSVLGTVTSNYNGADISCPGANDGSANGNASGGTGPYTYQWTDINGIVVGNGANLTNVPAGTYTVTATDLEGCTATFDVTLSDPPVLVLDSYVTSDYNGADVSCFGSTDGAITVDLVGGTPAYTYTWRDENGIVISNAQSPNGLVAGDYEVTVTDANGCISLANVTVTEPDELIVSSQVISDYNGADVSCFQYEDGSVQADPVGGTPGYQYSWSDATGVIGTTQSLITSVGAGIYNVQVTDVNGCDATSTVTVTEPTPLVAQSEIISNYFGAPISCLGNNDGIAEATYSGGTAGYSVAWNTIPPVNTGYFDQFMEGIWTATVTDANGCTDTTMVNMWAESTPLFDIPNSVVGCIGSEIVIDANASTGSNCEWTFSDGTTIYDCGPIIFNFDQTVCLDMQLIVSNSQGCRDTIAITEFLCVAPDPVASFTAESYELYTTDPDTYFYNSSTGASNFIWNFGDGTPLNYQEEPYHQFPTATGQESFEVWLYAISDFGCIDSTNAYINMTEELILYVPNTFTPDGDAYNNEFVPILSSGYDPRNYELMIFNRWGELIFNSTVAGEGWDGTYKGTKCQEGVYTWKLKVMNINTDRKEEFVGHVSLLRGAGL